MSKSSHLKLTTGIRIIFSCLIFFGFIQSAIADQLNIHTITQRDDGSGMIEIVFTGTSSQGLTTNLQSENCIYSTSPDFTASTPLIFQTSDSDHTAYSPIIFSSDGNSYTAVVDASTWLSGNYYIQLGVSDTVTAVSDKLTIDNEPPEIPIIQTHDGKNFSTIETAVVLTGTCDLQTSIIRLNASEAGITYTEGSGVWEYSGALLEGINVFVVDAIDSFGNASDSYTMMIKNLPVFEPCSARIPHSGDIQCFGESNEIGCPQAGEPFYGQAGNFKINEMSFTKLDENGNSLPDDADNWLMVRDNLTGLIWEIKQANDGMQDYDNPNDADNTYSWYDPTSENSTDYTGSYNDGINTQAFIAQLNQKQLGGYSDWRFPSLIELANIANLSSINPAIEDTFFPGIMSDFYWSSSTNAEDTIQAWGVYFYSGSIDKYAKESLYYVRAVRGEHCQPTDSLVLNGDGTITDVSNGIMWELESSNAKYTWEKALEYCTDLSLAMYADWRLPEVKEFRSIVDYTKHSPAINTAIFSDTLSESYWTSRSNINIASYGWCINFQNGADQVSMKFNTNNVRAVRGGQSLVSGNLFIVSPQQGSFWKPGETMPIAWETQNITGDVKISISREGGRDGTYETIAETANDGAYEWTVSGDISVNCMLKIEPLNELSKGTRQGLFSIYPITPRKYQQIILMPAATTVSTDTSLTITANYSTSDNAKSSGIGLRFHYNAALFEFKGFNGISLTPTSINSEPKPDTNNFDNDPSTDSYVALRWFSPEMNWPQNALALNLADLNFKTIALGQGSINVSFLELTEGFTGSASNAAIQIEQTENGTNIDIQSITQRNDASGMLDIVFTGTASQDLTTNWMPEHCIYSTSPDFTTYRPIIFQTSDPAHTAYSPLLFSSSGNSYTAVVDASSWESGNYFIQLGIDADVLAVSNKLTIDHTPPVIDKIAPNRTIGIGMINISGSNFYTNTTVTIAGIPSEAVYYSSTKLSVSVPMQEIGAVNVMVTNPNGQTAIVPNGLTYVELPCSCPVPDSGQTKCYDNNGNEISCPKPGEPFYGQAGNYTINEMSFTKMDNNGNDLTEDAENWVMVRDNVTGLIWEVKQAKDDVANFENPSDADNQYTWYDTNPANNLGYTGYYNDGKNTQVFIEQLNQKQLGGFNDWRMPSPKELASIANLAKIDPAIDVDLFPGAMSAFYWSSTSNASYTGGAWGVNFLNSLDYNGAKDSSYYVRAVRGGQCWSFDNWVINGDRTITDIASGLMWELEAKNTEQTWKNAMDYCEKSSFSTYTDWRLPEQKEIRSIVDFLRYNPASNIDYFHDTMSAFYWSSTSGADDTGNAWGVLFNYGGDNRNAKVSSYIVRAVRGGQSWVFGHLFIGSPKQASFWQPGDIMPINWETQNISGNVKISLSREGGRSGTFETIAITENDGYYEWIVAGDISVNCMLKIEPVNEPDKGTRQGLFTIHTYSNQKYQTVALSPATTTLSNQSAFTLTANYSSSDNGKTNGIDIRFHYDSSLFEFTGFNGISLTPTLINSEPRPDTDNYDNDSSTDSYVRLGWKSSIMDWPQNFIALNLANLNFNAIGFGQGNINVSFVEVSDGYTGNAKNARVNKDQAVNTPPVISLITDQTINEDSTGIISFSITDAESAPCDLSLSIISSDPTILPDSNIAYTCSENNYTLTASPEMNQSGSLLLSFIAEDNEGLTASTTVSLTINAVNDPPIIFGINNQTITEISSFADITLDNFVLDVDNLNSELNWTAIGQSALQVTITNNIANTAVPYPGWIGTETVFFIVTDPEGLTASYAVDFTVTRQEEQIISLSSAYTQVNIFDSVNIEVNYRTSDLNKVNSIGLGFHFDSSKLEFTQFLNELQPPIDYDQTPKSDTENLDDDAETDQYVSISWFAFTDSFPNASMPAKLVDLDFNAIGVGPCNINVSFLSLSGDYIGRAENTSFIIEQPVNTKPEISQIPDQIMDEDTQSLVHFTVNDIETAPCDLTLSITSSNQTILPDSNISHTCFENNYTITASPLMNQHGSLVLALLVQDPEGLTASTSLQLTINAVNDPPIISDINDQTITEGATFADITLNNFVEDVDHLDSELSWTATGQSALQVTIVNNIASIEILNQDWTGTETVFFTATDTDGLTSTYAVDFTVNLAESVFWTEPGSDIHLNTLSIEGESKTIRFKANVPSGEVLNAYKFTIAYDSDKVSVEAIKTPGSQFSPANVNSSTSGLIIFNGFSTSGVAGPATIGFIDVTLTGTQQGLFDILTTVDSFGSSSTNQFKPTPEVLQIEVLPSQKEQIVSLVSAEMPVYLSEPVNIEVNYSTTDLGKAFGIEIRLHYDSSKLEFIQFDNEDQNPIPTLIDPQPKDDTSDYDNDANTDQFVLISWGKTTENVPYTELPIKLVDLVFNAIGLGQANINVSISDVSEGYAGKAENTSVIIRKPVNTKPEISHIPDQIMDEDTQSLVHFTVNDIETAPCDFIFSITSSDQTILPDSNISHTCSENNYTITASPLMNQYGSLFLDLLVDDPEGLTASTSFLLTINAVNDPPIISGINDQTITEGASFADITLNNFVEDVDHLDSELSWTATGQSALQVTIVNNIARIEIPNQDWTGTETVFFTASDPYGFTTTEAVDFTVVPQKNQIVSLSAAKSMLNIFDTVHIEVNYRTSDLEKTTGIGIRIHYDSKKLEFTQFHNVLQQSLLSVPLLSSEEDDNLDDDEATDQFIVIAWADVFTGSFPNTDMPTKLLDLEFNAIGLGQSNINVSFTSVGFGYAGKAENAAITILDNGTIDIQSITQRMDGSGMLDIVFTGTASLDLTANLLPENCIYSTSADFATYSPLIFNSDDAAHTAYSPLVFTADGNQYTAVADISTWDIGNYFIQLGTGNGLSDSEKLTIAHTASFTIQSTALDLSRQNLFIVIEGTDPESRTFNWQRAVYSVKPDDSTYTPVTFNTSHAAHTYSLTFLSAEKSYYTAVVDISSWKTGTYAMDLSLDDGLEQHLSDILIDHTISTRDPNLHRCPIPDFVHNECFDSNQSIDCPDKNQAFYGQDGSYLINEASYIKMDANGNDLPDDASSWAMVRDTVTGLIWEVKQMADGEENYSNPNDADNKYTWYAPDDPQNTGEENNQRNTYAFIQQLNQKKLGGYSNWRIPTIQELETLVNHSETEPTIAKVFASTKNEQYWSSTTAAFPTMARVINFNDGESFFRNKTNPFYTRGVVGQKCQRQWKDNGDQTITDICTGLVWEKNASEDYTWEESLNVCNNKEIAGYSDWRLPSKMELRSIIDYSKNNPSIDSEIFHNQQSEDYWTSTSNSGTSAWTIHFGLANDSPDTKRSKKNIRAVRGGQSDIKNNIWIQSPALASQWFVGDTMSIQWDTQSIESKVEIYLSREGGKDTTFDLIATTENDGQYTWIVSGSATVNAVLKIKPVEYPKLSNQVGMFSIKIPTQMLTLSSPKESYVLNEAFGLKLSYQTNLDRQTFGMGICFHYSDQFLEFNGFSDSFTRQLIEEGQPMPDIDNLDGDDNTDTFVFIKWQSFYPDWPSSELPLDLTTLQFKTRKTGRSPVNMRIQFADTTYPCITENASILSLNQPPIIEIESITQRTDGSGLLDVIFTGSDPENDVVQWDADQCRYARVDSDVYTPFVFHEVQGSMTFTSTGASFTAVIDASSWPDGNYQIQLAVNNEHVPVKYSDVKVDNSTPEITVDCGEGSGQNCITEKNIITLNGVYSDDTQSITIQQSDSISSSPDKPVEAELDEGNWIYINPLNSIPEHEYTVVTYAYTIVAKDGSGNTDEKFIQVDRIPPNTITISQIDPQIIPENTSEKNIPFTVSSSLGGELNIRCNLSNNTIIEQTILSHDVLTLAANETVRLTLTIIPTRGRFGESDITIQVEDQFTRPNIPTQKFTVEVTEGNWWFREYDFQWVDISVASENNMVAIDRDGAIYQFNGQFWKPHRVDYQPLSAIWGNDEDDVYHMYAVGDNGYFIHYNGVEWTPIKTDVAEKLVDIWGTGTDILYCVSRAGNIYKYEDSLWQLEFEIPGFPLNAIWGSSSINIYAVGDSGTLVHFDLSEWKTIQSPIDENLTHIWGSDKDNIYAVGENGSIIHYDGVQWSSESSPVTSTLNAIWGVDETAVFAVGYSGVMLQKENAEWQALTRQSANLNAIAGTDINHMVSVGDNGIMLSFDGSQWTQTASYLTAWSQMTDITQMTAIWGLSDICIFASGYAQGNSVIFQYNGQQWDRQTLADNRITDIWGSDDTNVFAVGENGQILYYNGQIWSTHESGIENKLNAVWGSSSSDVFAVGNDGILHYDGTSWTQMDSEQSVLLNDIWGRSSQDVYAVGANGVILHYNGTHWQQMERPTASDLLTIQGNNTYMYAGGEGIILFYENETWKTFDNTQAETIIDISPPFSDEWFAISKNTIWQCNTEKGACDAYLSNDLTMRAIWGSFSQDRYVIADNGIILHYKANKAPENPNQKHFLQALYAQTNGNQWTVNPSWQISESECAWFGITCNENQQVININLEQANLNGSLPQSIDLISDIEYLSIQGNLLHGSVPAQIQSLTHLLDNQSDFRYNALYTDDPAIREFLNQKQIDGNWESTQTILPSNISAKASFSTITVTWTPLTYTQDPGYYEMIYRAQSGPALSYSTADKTASSAILKNLQPDTHYEIRMRSVTLKHANNPNDIYSQWSLPNEITTLNTPTTMVIESIAQRRDASGYLDIVFTGTDLETNTAGFVENECVVYLPQKTPLAFVDMAYTQMTFDSDGETYTAIVDAHDWESGTYEIQLMVENGDSVSQSFTVDNTPPTKPTISTGDGLDYTTVVSTQMLTGTCDVETTIITINGNSESVQVNPDGSWSYTLNLEIGENAITIQSVDQWGNSSEITQMDITYNIPIISPAEKAALVDLYNQTSGSQWKVKWNIGSTDPEGTECSWHGITCNETKEFVIGINLPNNRLIGEVPESIKNLNYLKDNQSDFRFNGLISKSPEIVDFMNAKQIGGQWRNTQTVTPENFRVSEISYFSIQLSWDPIAYTINGEYVINWSSNSSGPFEARLNKTASTYTVTELADDTEYSFNIQTYSTDGWSSPQSYTAARTKRYNDAPNAPSSPLPENLAENTAVTPTLSWTCSDPNTNDTLSYQLFLETSDDLSTPLATHLTQMNYTVESALNFNTTYYWRIDATDQLNKTTSGPTWQFTTKTPTLTIQPMAQTLKLNSSCQFSYTISDADPSQLTVWATSSNPVLVPIDNIVFNDLEQVSITPTENISGVSTITLFVTDGHFTASSPFELTVLANDPPETPSLKEPENNTNNIELTPTLRWSCTDPNPLDTLTYTLYLSTSNNLVTPQATNITQMNYKRSTPLQYGKTYYWRIDATDNHGAVTQGPVWQFRTIENTPPELTVQPIEQLTDGSGRIKILFTGTDMENESFKWEADECQFIAQGSTSYSKLNFETSHDLHTANEPMTFSSTGTQYTAIVDASTWETGYYNIELTVKGSNTVYPATFYVDHIPPSPPVITTSNGNNYTTTEQMVTINFEYDKDIMKIITGDGLESEMYTHTSFTFALEDGENHFSFRAVDHAGNVSDDSSSIVINYIKYQTVELAPVTQTVSHGNSLTLTAFYSTTDNNTDVGIGLRLHYASELLAVESISDSHEGAIDISTDNDDLNNFDNDDSTDKYIAIRWPDTANQWQAEIANKLLDIHFKSKIEGETNVNISTSAMASGYLLSAVNAEIISIDTPPEIQIKSVDQRTDGSGLVDISFIGIDAENDTVNWSADGCKYLSQSTALPLTFVENNPMTFSPDGTPFTATIDASTWESVDYTITLAVDKSAPANIHISIDNKPPELPEITIIGAYGKGENYTTTSSNVTLTGTCMEDTEALQISETIISCQANPSWQQDITLSEGINTIDIWAFDESGNESYTSITINFIKEFLIVVKSSSQDGGAIRVNGDESLNFTKTVSLDDPVTITAISKGNYTFVQWSIENKNYIDASLKIPHAIYNNIHADTIEITAFFNQPPKKPEVIEAPAVENTSVTIITDTFKDDDADSHATTLIKLWLEDQYDNNLTEEEPKVLTLQASTASVLTRLSQGLKYHYQVGYQDTGSKKTSWSDEDTFVTGIPEKRNPKTIFPGVDITEYEMISFTQWPSDKHATSLFDSLGVYEDDFRVGTYDPEIGNYIEYPNNLIIQPGRAYWILIREGHELSLDGVPVSKDVDFDVPLKFNPNNPNDGWNMIACPNDASYQWSEIKALQYDNPDFKKSELIDTEKGICQWNHSETKPYLCSTDLETFELKQNEGYWVRALTSNVILRFPAPNKKKRSIRKVEKVETQRQYVSSDPPMPMSDDMGIIEVYDSTPGGCFVMNLLGNDWIYPIILLLVLMMGVWGRTKPTY